MNGKRGLSGVEIVCVVIALGLLSVAAIPRYIDGKRESQREERAEAARTYIQALNRALTAYANEHGPWRMDWLRDGQVLMDLLEGELEMPAGMRYRGNVWVEEGTELRWRFYRGSGYMPPRILRMDRRTPLEPGEIEPIRRPSR